MLMINLDMNHANEVTGDRSEEVDTGSVIRQEKTKRI